MNSKISLLTKKRVGIKTKVDEFSTKVAEMDINVHKLLGDVWEIKTSERKNTALVKQLQETIEKYQATLDKWVKTQEVIIEKSNEIEERFDRGEKQLIESIVFNYLTFYVNNNKSLGFNKVELIQKDLIKRIDSFTKEYKEGFKRIVKLEVISSHHK